MVRTATGHTGPSWRGVASLSTMMLLLVKAAVFAHYGMHAASRTELLALHAVGGAASRSSRDGVLSWLEQGVTDVEQDLAWLGPDGGADVGRTPAVVTGAGGARLKHSVHREMMRDSSNEAAVKRKAAPASHELSLPIILPPQPKSSSAHLKDGDDSGSEEFGQSGFTVDQLRDAASRSSGGGGDDDDDDAARTGKEIAAATLAVAAAAPVKSSGLSAGGGSASSGSTLSTSPYTDKALIKDDPLGFEPPAGGLVDEAQPLSATAAGDDDSVLPPPESMDDDEGMDPDDEGMDDEGMDEDDEAEGEGEGMDDDDEGGSMPPAAMKAPRPAALEVRRARSSPARQQLLQLTALSQVAESPARADAAALPSMAPEGVGSSTLLKKLHTVDESGASRRIGPVGQSKGEVDGDGAEEEEERHEYSWDKSWWTARAWFLWTITGPTIMCLLFILSCLSQGLLCVSSTRSVSQ